MKGILFNQDMVRAILNGTNTVTRRVVRPQLKTKCSHGGQHEFIQDDFIEGVNFTGFVCRKCGYGVCGPHFKFPVGTSWIRPPYRPGDILYVRETWQHGFGGTYLYRASAGYDLFMTADGKLVSDIPWRPSIHMPREAARIFLRVTDVRVKRLQDITEEQALSEGARKEYQHYYDNVVTAREFFSGIWNSTIKPADRARYGWDANPWVWVIEFERISREEALANG